MRRASCCNTSETQKIGGKRECGVSGILFQICEVKITNINERRNRDPTQIKSCEYNKITFQAESIHLQTVSNA